jgi:uncharacterized membrane protein
MIHDLLSFETVLFSWLLLHLKFSLNGCQSWMDEMLATKVLLRLAHIQISRSRRRQISEAMKSIEESSGL